MTTESVARVYNDVTGHPQNLPIADTMALLAAQAFRYDSFGDLAEGCLFRGHPELYQAYRDGATDRFAALLVPALAALSAGAAPRGPVGDATGDALRLLGERVLVIEQRLGIA